MGEEVLSFSTCKSFESTGLNISEMVFEISFKLFSRKLSCNITNFGREPFFSTRISESSLLINPLEIRPHLGEI